jgi:gluconate kinase
MEKSTKYVNKADKIIQLMIWNRQSSDERKDLQFPGLITCPSLKKKARPTLQQYHEEILGYILNA